ncbi:winged helix-turn-helix transcriptional regulator [Streptomyces sp. NBC_00370]|uniref:winged helix-turn-helix transcriptional regulator n=1 Tax=Streptomyces sp. NBC_00370 TaxID=2975728 RepID=UPI002E259A0C
MNTEEHVGEGLATPLSGRTAPGFEHIDEELCRSFRRSAELVGRKWTAGILLAGMLGARRFIEYRAHVDGISDKLLTQRLRELEAEGLLERHVAPTTPVLVTYRPSERAAGLMRALHPLVKWSIVDQKLARAART